MSVTEVPLPANYLGDLLVKHVYPMYSTRVLLIYSEIVWRGVVRCGKTVQSGTRRVLMHFRPFLHKRYDYIH